MTAAEAYISPQRRTVLHRETFRTSRLIEFCSRKELVNQTGHDVADWPLVAAKELLDNAFDACEEAGIAPEILVTVSTTSGEIIVVDNGPGMGGDVIADILDYSVRVSSREAYCSPTRGAQGNAWKTLAAMPFALDGTRGEVLIASRGVEHRIGFRVDQLRQEPRITHDKVRSAVQTGTAVTIKWPDSACSILTAARERFLQIGRDFAWLNPHAAIRLTWDGEVCVDCKRSDPLWRKWLPSEPTSPHWYNAERFERYIAAHLSRDQDTGRRRLVREFISELRGLSGSLKQKAVLNDTGLGRAELRSLFDADGAPDHAAIQRLLAAAQRHSRPVKPKLLGIIGREHLLASLQTAGVAEESFKYQKAVGEIDGLPWVVETAFGYAPDAARRQIVAGVNFSVGLGNPFRSFRRYGGEGLEALLNRLWAAADEPIVYVIHYTCPRIDFTDRGKSALIIPSTERWR